jgi:hypothetical protein
MGNRVLISRLHDPQPVAHRFQAEKRGEKWRIGYESDQLRQRMLRYMGRTTISRAAWWSSNCGMTYTAWGQWMCGERRLPAKYHMALDRFLTEHGC